MKKNKTKHLSFFIILRNIMLVFGISYVAFLITLACITKQNNFLDEWCERYPGTWIATLPDGTEQPVTMPTVVDVVRGLPVTFTTTIPDSFPDGTSIMVQYGRPVKVIIDGKMRFEMPESYYPLPGGAEKVHFAFIHLNANDAGRTMTVTFDSASENNGSLSAFYWGTSFGIWKFLLRSYGLKFIAALLLLSFSIASFLYGIYTQVRYKTGAPILFLSIGISTLSAWAIFDSFLFQFLWSNAYIDGIMGYMSIMLAPYPFIYFLDLMQKHRHQKLFAICTVGVISDFVVMNILHFSGVLGFYDSMIYMNLFLAIVLCCIFGTIIYDFVKKYAKEYIYVAIGHVGLAVFALIEIIEINVTSTHFLDNFFMLLGLYFLLILSFIQVIYQSRDVQRKMENALRSNTFKTNFLANMSHEIRTPINAIMGMDDMILREKINDNVREYAGNIQNASTTLLSIINEILDFSKIESGKMEVLNAPYSLSSVINDVVTMIKVQTTAKKLDFILDIEPNLPDNLRGDPTKLRQVMINLLNNATKYTEKGSIRFGLHGERLGSEIRLRFEIADTGVGIAKEDLPKLYTKFQRLDELHHHNVEGTGLGLSITARFVDMLKGKIDVDSELNKGTTFTVTIDQEVLSEEVIKSPEVFGRAAVPAQIDHEFTSFTAPDARILVVDDNQMNLAVAKGLLKQTEMRIDTCLSGIEMLERIANVYYDVILLDHMMPDLDGIETLHRAKQLPNNLCINTPIIAMTANAISGVREKYIAEGFTDYISKPVRGRELEDMIRKYLPEDLVCAPKNMDVTKVTTPEMSAPDEFDFKYAISLTGSEEILRESLSDFCKFLSDFTERLEKDYAKLPDETAIKNYQIKVHSLKSSAATVGALLLSKTARLLEVAASEQDVAKIRVLHPILCEEIEKHYERIVPLFADNASDVELIDAPEDMTPTLETLKDALNSFDYDTADTICDELAGYRYPDDITCKIKLLLDQISEFERENAVTTINELIEKYK